MTVTTLIIHDHLIYPHEEDFDISEYITQDIFPFIKFLLCFHILFRLILKSYVALGSL